ncbi:HlyD family secretion protein [Salinispira pacifica]
MKRSLIIGLLIAIGVLGNIGIVLYFRHQDIQYVITDDATVDADQLNVSASVMGRIAQMEASAGTEVSRGTPLFSLSADDLAARVTEAKISLDTAAGAVDLARVHLIGAEDDLSRARTQLQAGAIAQAQFDRTLTATEEARTRLVQAESRRQAAVAALRAARDQDAKTRVTSPVDGVVARRFRTTGDVVRPGQKVYAIYDLSNVWVTANIEETRIRFVRPGEQVRITADALPGRLFRGTVERVGRATAATFSPIAPSGGSANFTKRVQRIPVRIALLPSTESADSAALLPGMSAQVRISISP